MDDSERALATQVLSTKAALLDMLTEEERQSRKITKDDSRTHVWTFEDSANALDRPELKQALKAYQQAVNAFWVRTYCDGTPERIYRQWQRKNRALARTILREEVEAEIVFRLRDAIERFDPAHGVPFQVFAAQRLIGGMRLVEWARQEKTVVQRPRSVRRRSDFPFDQVMDHRSEPDDGSD